MARWKITNENKERLARLLDETPKVAYWEIAAQIGKHENTVSKWMRCPTDEQTEIIENAVNEIRNQN